MKSKVETKENYKKQKGITLLALTVTIVVLLILAGVTVTTLVGDNGIIEKAQTSSYETIKSEFLTSVHLDILAKELGKEDGENITMSDIEDVLNKYYTEGTIEEIIRDADGNVIEVKVKDLNEKITISEIREYAM